MGAEVDEVVGPKGKHDSGRSAKRHGHESASVTLGARRMPVSRPRVRSADDEHELTLSDALRRRAGHRGREAAQARDRLDPG